jgi:hypothetical protein
MARRLMRVIAVAVVAGACMPASALAAGTLVASPDARDFGGVEPGARSLEAFTIENEGPDAVTIGAIGVHYGDNEFEVSSGSCVVGIELASGASCSVLVAFNAPVGQPASYEAALVVDGGVGDARAMAQVLARVASPTGGLQIRSTEPTGIIYGNRVIMETGRLRLKDMSVRAFDLRTGLFQAAFVGPLPISSPFRIVSNSCGEILGAGGSCSLAVKFEPPPVEPRGSREARTTTYHGLLTMGTGTHARSLMLEGTQWHPLKPDPPEVRPAAQLDRLARAVARLVRGGPRRELALPAFDVDAAGTLRLRLWAKVTGRLVPITRATTTVGSNAGERLRFRLWRKGRTLLAGGEPRRIRAKVSFTVLSSGKTHSKVRAFRVRPPSG